MAYYVADRFRTNPLSLRKNTGKDVMIFYYRGCPKIYTRVQSPYKYWVEAKKEDPNVRSYKVLRDSVDF